VDCPTLTIPQGTTRQITATNIIGSDGSPLDITGWSVHAVIRAPGIGSPIVGEWSTTSATGIGVASVSGNTMTLLITADMSAAWDWSRGVLQAELTEPGPGGRTERIIDQPVRLSPEAVTS
jgi:hypothetical protein